MKRKVLLACILALSLATIATSQTADQLMVSLAEKLKAAHIESGMVVSSASTNGPGYRAGLRVGDLVVSINDQPVTDSGSFATLRDRFRGTPSHFTIWRDGSYVTLPDIMMPAAVDISGTDWSYAMAQILMKIDAGDAEGVRKLIQEDEAGNKLSPKDLLIAKLLNLPAGPLAPGSDQENFTNELAASLSPNDCVAAAALLRSHGRDWSSVVLQRKVVGGNPSNVNSRLNLASLLARLNLNDEAEQNVRYILDQPKPALSNYGYSVAENVLATVAANRGQNEEAGLHRQRASVYSSAPAGSPPALPPFRPSPAPKPGLNIGPGIPPELAKQLKSTVDEMWSKWMKTGDIRTLNDVRLQSVLQNPPCSLLTTVTTDSICAMLKPEERRDLLLTFENTIGLMLNAMMSQDIETLMAKMDAAADSMGGGADPTGSQLFGMFSPLLGSDVAAPLAEVGLKPTSLEGTRRELAGLQQAELAIKARHARDFESTSDTYQKNAEKIAENMGDELDVAEEPPDATIRQDLGLQDNAPIYVVRKDIYVFMIAIVDGQMKLVSVTGMTE